MKYKMKLFLIAVLLITVGQSILAQEFSAPNKMFFCEFGGPGMVMSANFDSRIKPNTRHGLGFRIGAGFGLKMFPHSSENMYTNVTRTVYSIPAGINYIFGKTNSASTFEVGAGASIMSRKASYYNYDVEKDGNMIGFITFMYRVAPINGGMSFRVGFTPLIGTAGDLFPMGAIGFGYAF